MDKIAFSTAQRSQDVQNRIKLKRVRHEIVGFTTGRGSCEGSSSLLISLNTLALAWAGASFVTQEVEQERNGIGLGAEAVRLARVEREIRYTALSSRGIIPAPRLGGANAKTCT